MTVERVRSPAAIETMRSRLNRVQAYRDDIQKRITTTEAMLNIRHVVPVGEYVEYVLSLIDEVDEGGWKIARWTNLWTEDVDDVSRSPFRGVGAVAARGPDQHMFTVLTNEASDLVERVWLPRWAAWRATQRTLDERGESIDAARQASDRLPVPEISLPAVPVDTRHRYFTEPLPSGARLFYRIETGPLQRGFILDHATQTWERYDDIVFERYGSPYDLGLGYEEHDPKQLDRLLQAEGLRPVVD